MSEEPTKTEADDELSKLGYAQELARAMGGFSSFAVSFSIISILTGIVTTYGSALAGGGPAALGLAARSGQAGIESDGQSVGQSESQTARKSDR